MLLIFQVFSNKDGYKKTVVTVGHIGSEKEAGDGGNEKTGSGITSGVAQSNKAKSKDAKPTPPSTPKSSIPRPGTAKV